MPPTSTEEQPPAPRGRRGRPRAGEQAARRARVLDAALAELVEQGPDRMTMLSVAKRAGASKETLYAWFGNRDGLLRALIERNADGSAERVATALEEPSEPRDVLIGYAAGLLTLLTAPPSIALNRAAMTNPELAALLLEGGRHRVGPLVESYLSRLDGDGLLTVSDPAAAFMLLYGLTVQDTQIRVLLGEDPPTAPEIRARAVTAVDAFLSIVR